MNARIILTGFGLFTVLVLSACGDNASDSITSTDVTCLHMMEAGGSCNGTSSSSTVTVSAVSTVTATSSSVTTVTTVGTSDLTLRPTAILALAQ